jgi:hypothetical protein
MISNISMWRKADGFRRMKMRKAKSVPNVPGADGR